VVVLVSLRAVNFRRLNIPEPLQLPKGLVIIRGRNEAGKSTLLEAILFGLYGEHRVISALRGNARLEDAVNHRSNRAFVEVVFEVDGRRYRVERTIERERGGARQVDAKLVEIAGGGERLVAVGVAKVNEAVQKLLRVSWQEMLATNVIAQKDLERIVEMGKAERDRVINMLMGFESYNKAADKLDEERRELQQELQLVVSERDGVAGQIKRLEELAGKLDAWRSELEAAKRRVPELEARKIRVEKALGYLERLENALKRKLDARRRLEDARAKLEQARAELAELEGELSELRGALEGKRGELERIEASLEALEGRLREAEGRWRRLLEVSSKVGELWRSYADASRDLEELRRRVAELEGRLGGLPKLKAERERMAERLRELAEAAPRGLPRWSLAAAAASAAAALALYAAVGPWSLLGLAAAAALLALGAAERSRRAEALRLEEGRVRGELSRVEAELASLERDREELERLKAREGELRERLNALLSQLSGAGGEDCARDPRGCAEALSREEGAARAEYEEVSRLAGEARQRASALKAEIDGYERRARELEREIEELRREAERLEGEVKRLEAEYASIGVPEPPFAIEGLEPPLSEEKLEAVAALRSRYAQLLAEASSELAKLVSKIGELSKAIAETEKALGELPALKARLAELEARAKGLEAEVAARRAAVEALRSAAAKVRAAFVPSVESNMSWVISHVTGGRYKAVRINPDTYDVEVYDAEAGRWLRRDIYSGGTNDQFLLAMRIAFALSLLPAAKGAYPRFLFLDEPLGSSDEERRGRIVELLASELTRFFDQIFLVTHVEVEEPPGSTVVTIENGAIQRVHAVGASEAPGG
jgi:exonuclease SbcC